MNKPIGVSEYGLNRALPPRLKSDLPTVEEIEAELCEEIKPKTTARRKPTRKSEPAKKLTKKMSRSK